MTEATGSDGGYSQKPAIGLAPPNPPWSGSMIQEPNCHVGKLCSSEKLAFSSELQKKNGEFVNSEICLMCGKVCGMIAMACTWIVGLLSRHRTWIAEYRLNWCIPRALCPEQPRIWIESHPQGELLLLQTYGGWKKSCTTWVAWNPMNNGINQLSTGAGSLPSTVLSISLSVYLSIFLAVSWSVCLSVCPSIYCSYPSYLSYLSMDLFLYLSICIYVWPIYSMYTYVIIMCI